MLPNFASRTSSLSRPVLCVGIPFCEETENTALLEHLAKYRNDYPLQVVVFNNTGFDPVKTRQFMQRFGWQYHRFSLPLSENEYQKEMCLFLQKQPATYYMVLPSDSIAPDKFFSIALAAWNSIGDVRKGILSFSQDLPVIVRSPTSFTERVSDIGNTFLFPRQVLDVICRWDANLNLADYLQDKGFSFYQTRQIKIKTIPQVLPNIPVPSPNTIIKSFANTPVIAGKTRKAIFLTATRDRPRLLEAVLTSLKKQTIPNGWTIECVVTGHPNDTGKALAIELGATYVEVESLILTDKLNYCVNQTDAELVMMADDDDIQPESRAVASIRAYESGADWSATGSVYYFDVATGKVTKWDGTASRGMVGTSLSYSTKLLRQVGGWATRSQGKDGPLAAKIHKLGLEIKFADITNEMPLIVSIQHSANIWKRPALDKGVLGVQGSFKLTGLGTLDEVSDIAEESKVLLRSVQDAPEVPVVVPVDEPLAIPEEDLLWTCVPGGHGTQAYADGLKVLGFKQVPYRDSEQKLMLGLPVLYHGWRRDMKELGRKYPGQVFVLWHSGWTGSDIMGEGQALADVMDCAKQDIIKLLWLEQRDIPPAKAIQVYPIWDPVAMSQNIPDPKPVKEPNSVVVGLHNDWAALCKNSMAAVVACASTGAKLHIGGPAMRGMRGLALQKVLQGVEHEIHPMMPKLEALKLVASCELLVHPSVSDTWPYLVMESIYAGTPVVVSDTIAWAKELSPWAQESCLIQAACSSRDIAQRVKGLIHDTKSRCKLLEEQKTILNSLAKIYQNKMSEVLSGLGFAVKKDTQISDSNTLHLLIDSPDWAFDRIATQIQIHSKYNIQKHYISNHESISEGVVFWWKGYYKYVKHPENSMVCVYDFLSWDEQTVNEVFSKFKIIGVANEMLYEKMISFPSVQNKPIFILRDGVDTDVFKPLPKVGGANKLQVGWVGNSSWGDDSDFKGFKILQEVKQKTETFCDWHIADKKQNPIPFEKMPEYYRKLDILTCFSKAEGTPNPALEGAASGCLVLSTEVGLIPELKRSGCVVEVVDRNVSSFVRTLKRLYQSNKKIVSGAYGTNPPIMKQEWDWSVRIKEWHNALDCLMVKKPEQVADLSDVVTVFVTTVGALDFSSCVSCLNNQDVKFQLKVIRNVAPMSAAFQKMIDDCTTEYYIQVDEDMLLYPHAVRTLYEKIKQQDKKIAMFFMGLHDVFTGFCLVGVKIYRHSIMKQFPYVSTDFSCEVDQIARMQKKGYAIRGETPGLHGKKELCAGDLNAFWTEWGIFEKYSRDMQKFKLYPKRQAWMKELPSVFIKKIREGNKLAGYALVGSIIGLIYPVTQTGEKDFTKPAFKEVFNQIDLLLKGGI